MYAAWELEQNCDDDRVTRGPAGHVGEKNQARGKGHVGWWLARGFGDRPELGSRTWAWGLTLVACFGGLLVYKKD